MDRPRKFTRHAPTTITVARPEPLAPDGPVLINLPPEAFTVTAYSPLTGIQGYRANRQKVNFSFPKS